MLAKAILALLTAAPASPSGTATVPLSELIGLYGDSGRPGASPAPPVDALVVKNQLTGRLLPDAIAVQAHFEVRVLASDRWTRVGLLRLGPDVYPTELPSVEGATIAPLGDELCLVTQKPGAYSFDVGLSVRAAASGSQRRAQLEAGSHSVPSPLKLEADPALFVVLGRAHGAPGAREVFPEGRVWSLSWRSAVPAKSEVKPSARPPLEPTIPRAAASWVSTLEGKAKLRIRYSLRLDREREVELQLPEAHQLERVMVNGVPTEPRGRDGVLTVSVAPSSVGQTAGTLEVVMVRDLGTFHLSGRVRLSLPKVSWPITELTARAHLPSVFNYRREGGSLEPYEPEAEEPADEHGPLPGKVLRFRQFLVSASAPSLELGYSVDIADSYFR
ncbi:MAG: hypothetical protein HYZ28_03475 [Myxococcales bacterium]|nr:hypothetical protein [Myxococcales bacterium]